MNSNWFKFIMKMTKVEYGKKLVLKGVPIVFNRSGARIKIGNNVTIKSSFLSNLVGLYSRTVIVTRFMLEQEYILETIPPLAEIVRF